LLRQYFSGFALTRRLGGRGEVQHRVEGAVQHLRGVLDPALHELRAFRDARPEAGGQVVQHHHLVPGLHQMAATTTADVSGTTRDQKLLFRTH